MTREAALSVDQASTLTGLVIGSELHAGDVLGGRFRIESLIGIGGMGVVYRAHDLSLGIEVALKLLRPELARKPEAFESFRRELLLARQVSSPHVVRIHDIAEDNGRWFISMDYIAGESLDQSLDRERSLPVEQAIAITRCLLDGLAAAHQRGVVHRDLKPANVLINVDGDAYISDFGIARSLGATGLTQTGMIVGTPEYLSPEQARGRIIDARSDLYTVGLILYEMLVGDLPFAGGTPAEIVMQRILRPPPSLARARPDLPRWLHAFSDRLLKVNPAQRLESAKIALQALDSRRVPRPPLNLRATASAAAVLLALGTASVSLWRHPAFLSQLVTPAVTAVPRVALVPLNVPAGDAELQALARSLDTHLHAWLRGDPALAIVPRRRVLDALQRVAPDASGDVLARQLPEIAQAANATRLWSGALERGKDGQIALNLAEAGASNAKPLLALSGGNASNLFDAYVKAMPLLLASEHWNVGPAPRLPADAALSLGRAALALDARHPAEAAIELAKPATPPGDSALIEMTRLDAEEADHQQMPAQNTRQAIIRQFANATSPPERELYARALAGEDNGDKAAQTLVSATQAFPHDTSLALLDVETLEANGSNEQSMDLLKRIVRVDDQDARAWFLLGRAAIQQGLPRIAVDDYLLRALVLYTRGSDASAEAETRNALGIGYERLGQPDAAIEQYQRAAATREKLGDQIGLSRTLRNLAIVHSVSGHRELAEKTLDRARVILEKIGDRANLADLYNDRGVIAEERGDFDAAIDAYREGLAMRQQLGEQNLVAESLDNVGFGSYQMGRFDDAQVYWKQALSAYEQLDDHVRMLTVEQNMGLLDLARGHFAAARKRLESTLPRAEDGQLSEQVSVTLVDLAELALAEGRYAEAISHAERAAQISTRRSDRRTEAGAKLQLARSGLALGVVARVDKAFGSIQADQLGKEQQAALLLARAQRVQLDGDYKNALALLDQAAKSSATAHSGALDMQVRIERVQLLLASGDRAGASRFLKMFAEETSRLNEVPLRLQWLELEIATALGDGDRARAVTHYRRALKLLDDVGDYAHASTIHELGARALQDGTEAQAARSAAKTARDRLLAEAPPDARASLAEQLDRRLREEAPAINAH
ncbi:MAG: tetratricopeptide repeat protein [Dokdonella sp.]